MAIGFPARSSEEGCGPGGGPFVGPLVPEFYTDVLFVTQVHLGSSLSRYIVSFSALRFSITVEEGTN